MPHAASYAIIVLTVDVVSLTSVVFVGNCTDDLSSPVEAGAVSTSTVRGISSKLSDYEKQGLMDVEIYVLDFIHKIELSWIHRQ
jgi:hypothetical protein